MAGFFSTEGRQRRADYMNELSKDIEYYIPPELRPLAGFLADSTPTATVGRAGQSAAKMVAPDRSPMQRFGDLGGMLSETAGVVGPAMVAKRAGLPAAQAVQESLLGASSAPRAAGQVVVDRLNQRGPMPTLYSNALVPTAALNRAPLDVSRGGGGQVKQSAEEMRRQANIDRFGYDPNAVADETPSAGLLSQYVGEHRAPTRDGNAPAFNLAGDIYPDDIYSSNAVQYYGTGNQPMDRDTMSLLQSLRGQPDADVKIYRAVPKGVDDLNAGDWVTVNKQYAQDHGESALGGDFDIVERNVKASDIFTNGDSIHEFGYDPQPAVPATGNPSTLGLLGGNVRQRPPANKASKGDLDPFGYGSVKLDDYLDETDLGLTDLGENLPRTPKSWEDLEGGYVLPLYGDRTSRGYNIEGINDTEFTRPVYTEGGVDFMRGPANQQDNSVWASAKHIIDRLNNASIEAAAREGGRPVYGVTGSMAPNGVDFANMTGEAMAELVMGARNQIDPAAAKAFDELMMIKDPTYTGLLSDDLRDWAGQATSPNRKSFIRGLDTSPMRSAGVPSAALARYAVTDPTLRNVPSGQFGSAAARLRPDAPLLYNDSGHNSAPRAPHTTYNTQMQGDYVGELPLIPQGLLFRDAYDRMATQVDKNGNPLGEANKTYTIKTQLEPQLMTPEVVDGIMGYLANRQGRQ